MSPELSAFLVANGTLLVIAVAVLAVVGLVQWRKVRIAEQEHEFKQALIDKGVPLADIERAVATKAPARRGLLEQFGALSGGAKAGVIFAAIVALSMIGSTIHGIVFWSGVRQQQAAAHHQPPRDATPPAVAPAPSTTGHVFYLDLQPLANQKLTEAIRGDAGNSFAALPQQRQEFGGIPFQAGPGYVRLRGKHHPELPLEVAGVRVGFAFDRLHALHATEYGAFGDAAHRFHVADGTEVARLRLHYADDEERVIPVVYGQDVRDSWNWDRSRAASRGTVVWTGKTPSATREGVSLRLYLTTWDNPRPEVEVTRLDYVSGNTAATPVCVGLTAERVLK